MKKTGLVLLLLVGFLNEIQAQWILRNSAISTGYSIINHISIPSEKVAYAIGENVFALPTDYTYFTKTTNGGNLWVSGSIPGTVGCQMNSIVAIDDNTVWITMNEMMTSRGRIYKSTDGGTTWVRQGLNTFPNNNMAGGIHFFNHNEGIVYGAGDGFLGKEIYTTADGGATWVPVPAANIPTPILYEFNNGFTTNGNSLWFGTTKGRLYITHDKGQTWSVSTLPFPILKIDNLAFSDVNNGLVLGEVPASFNNSQFSALFRTTDGGATWSHISPPISGIFYHSDVCYVPGTKATFVQVGFDYTTNGNYTKGSAFTTDGGTSWQALPTVMPREAMSVKFFNQYVAYSGTYAIAGAGSFYSGGIYKFTGVPDVGVDQVTAPVTGCQHANETICVLIRNAGVFPISNIPVTYTVNGDSLIYGLMPGPISPGRNQEFCFPAKGNLAAAGANAIKIKTLLSGDAAFANDTLTATVTAGASPTPAFTIVPDSGRTFHFQNATPGTNTYTWFFGDADTSSLAAPSHTFPADGTYRVTLKATNVQGCSDTTSLLVTAKIPLPPPLVYCDLCVYPNPSAGEVIIEQDPVVMAPLEVEIYGAVGQLVGKIRVPAISRNHLALQSLAAGMYTLKITGRAKPHIVKLILVH